MARSTKTKHVMDLVGAEPVKKTAYPPKPAEKPEKPVPPPVTIPAEVKEELPPADLTDTQETVPEEPEAEEQKVGEVQPEEPKPEPVRNPPRITAVVCELINQELLNVAERFSLSLTDSNLWELTRSALEEVRPEFAVDRDDLAEKLERLRPKVIKAMTKAAIKISAKGRNA